MNSENSLVYSPHFGYEIHHQNFDDEIGQKAIGLLNCNQEEVPPFIIIPYYLFQNYISDSKSTISKLSNITDKIINAFNKLNVKKYIIRSSAKIEGFDERGFYDSIESASEKSDLKKSIELALEKNEPNVTDNNKLALIIQEFINPKLSGHLSNERRVSRNKTDWLLEIVNKNGVFDPNNSSKFSTSKNPITSKEISFKCSSPTKLVKQLKLFASNNISDTDRFHYEWIWDGKRFWIVQKDVENIIFEGSIPGSDWIKNDKIIEAFKPKVLNDIKNHEKKWRKLECVKTFGTCDLPQGKVYALDNVSVIKSLINQKRNIKLSEDLTQLLQYPIVIRMDIFKSDNYKGILLPRTETLFTLDAAYKFLMFHAKQFSEQGVKNDAFCFLIHRFIISKSCALAYAKPGIPRVRIDSTWGIVDGLYYHPHDSFEFNLTNDSVKKKIRSKTEYLDVDNTGKWFSKKSGIKWDWAESLNSEQLKNISKYTTKIADFLGEAVTVMYFVDVDKTTGYPNILPWFYTTEEIAEASEKFTDVIFSESREYITNVDDFEQIRQKVLAKNNSGKFSIKLKLTPDILREKHFIEEIGNFCKDNDIPIELDGSILSHTYYILRKCGAKVKCNDPFDPKYRKQIFYKLVRDKIPVIIESKGELAKSFNLDTKELLKFLKEKAIEESYEFFWEENDDKIIEELADIYEVIRSTCEIFEIPMEELVTIADKKVENKGGFEKGIFLLETAEQALIKVIPQTETAIEDLGFEEDLNSKEQYKLSQRNDFILSNDNSIIIPYIQPSDTYEGENISNRYVKLGSQKISIEYTSKGIILKNIPDNNYINPNQLSLFD